MKCSRLDTEMYTLYCEHEKLEWICYSCKEIIRRSINKSSEDKGWTTPRKVFKGYKPTHTVKNDVPTTRASPKKSPFTDAVKEARVNVPTGHIGTPSPRKVAEGANYHRQNNQHQKNKRNDGGKPSVVRKTKDPQNRTSGSPSIQLTHIKDQLHKLTAIVNNMAVKSTENTKRYSVLVYNNEEPFIREVKSRRDLDNRRIQAIFRMAGIPLNASIRKIHRVGKWRSFQEGKHHARPILVEFNGGKWRDFLLARTDLIWAKSGGRFQIGPDNRPKVEPVNKAVLKPAPPTTMDCDIISPIVCLEKREKCEPRLVLTRVASLPDMTTVLQETLCTPCQKNGQQPRALRPR